MFNIRLTSNSANIAQVAVYLHRETVKSLPIVWRREAGLYKDHKRSISTGRMISKPPL